MQKNEKNLILLNCFFVASLVVSNIIAGKVVMLFGLTFPAAVIAYPWTFLCTDIIGELWGKRQANQTVRVGIVVQIFSMVLTYAAIALPVAPYTSEFQAVFKAVLGSSGRFVFASLCAYLVSQFCDVTIFHTLKNKCRGKHKWLRNNASTMTSQLFDTAIFIGIGFWGTVPSILPMIFGQYIVKVFLALCDTPFFYYFTRRNKNLSKEYGILCPSPFDRNRL